MDSPLLSVSGGGDKSLILECAAAPPEFQDRLYDVCVPCGGKVFLRCRLRCHSHCEVGDLNIMWNKCLGDTGESVVVQNGGRYSISIMNDGVVSLEIESCQPTDAGEYSCLASNDAGSTMTSAWLCVTGLFQSCYTLIKLSSWLHHASMISNALLFNQCTQIYKTIKLLKTN